MSVALDKRVDDFIATKRQLFIDGQWVDAASGADVRDPESGDGRDVGHRGRGGRGGYRPGRPGRPPGL